MNNATWEDDDWTEAVFRVSEEFPGRANIPNTLKVSPEDDESTREFKIECRRFLKTGKK